MKTLDLVKAAEFLKVHPNTVLKLVNEGAFDGAKIGEHWVFDEEDLAKYLRNAIREQSALRRSGVRVKSEVSKVSNV